MLCGPAKTAALGVSLVSSQYGSHSQYLGKLLVPLVLYQAEQVMTAQILVNFMKKWIHAEDKPQDVELEQPEEQQEGTSTDVNNSPTRKSHDSTSQDST